MKPSKAAQKLAQKLYEVGIAARHHYDESHTRPSWWSLDSGQLVAWYAIAEYVLRKKTGKTR